MFIFIFDTVGKKALENYHFVMQKETMGEKEEVERKLLFLRSLDSICPDIPLERNRDTVIGSSPIVP